jgi:hypothetical protein
VPEPPRPKPKPKPRTKKAKNPTDDPNPHLNNQEEALGRTKRAVKRKVDFYLEAEEKDARQRKKKWIAGRALGFILL